jgi:thiamine-monophosphate kinase
MNELERIARLAEIFQARVAGVEIGIGDDAAVVVPPAGAKLVWTIDAQVEDVHFRRAYVSLEDIGYRATMAAASDVAAMGARPWCMLSSLVLGDDLDDASFEAIARGVASAAAEIGAPVVGGNLSRGAELGVTTTLLGSTERAIARGGAKAGDRVLLAGPLGLAAAGLRALAKGIDPADPRVAEAVRAWRRPVARIADGLAMSASAHACIDVSDGLARDAGHLARASGARVVLLREALDAAGGPALEAAARAIGADALDLVLHGGEDYALVCASPVDVPGFVAIGVIDEGQGVWLRTETGESEIAPRGFDHFA